ncbi:uncharacterized protein LOC112454807 [Temnothorax curvispinosus]|uniref:Uncharacterized protein LOC112454807 n=1 Tax=Temnothorax curvispinosus TaxID=300111 RepID=A0A6J1PS77_9HYME|nr:uncharacterized protein LOC112454807 [Temnothorax curvispinosus]
MRKERGMENSIQSDSEKEHKPKRKKMEENDTEESVDNNFTNREPQICDVTENKCTTDLLPKTKENSIQSDSEKEHKPKRKKWRKMTRKKVWITILQIESRKYVMLQKINVQQFYCQRQRKWI